MRIWSLHPKYLDSKGLVALWRETLLAKHVLEGRTRGYIHHPQLERFKRCESPLDAINCYLQEVFKEALRRNFHFDETKINRDAAAVKIKVTSGQLAYERLHLLKKLEIRDEEKYRQVKNIQTFAAHPMFLVEEGEVEDWEKRNQDGEKIRNRSKSQE